MDLHKNYLQIVGSNCTFTVAIQQTDVLEEEEPGVICIDELDKISRHFKSDGVIVLTCLHCWLCSHVHMLLPIMFFL
jgi:hypothetical protein